MNRDRVLLFGTIICLTGYFYLSCQKIEIKKQEQIKIEQQKEINQNKVQEVKKEEQPNEVQQLDIEKINKEEILEEQKISQDISQTNQQKESNNIQTIKEENQPKPTHVGRVRLEGDLATVELGEEMNREMELIPSNVVDSFFNNGGEVVITSYNIATTYYKDTSLGSIAGLFMSKENKIYIAHRKGCIRRAAIHEFGHYADKALNHISYTPEFKEIFNEEKNTFVEPSGIDKHYARSSVEFFAEVFAQSILNPDICKNTAPKAYNFVTNAIKSI